MQIIKRNGSMVDYDASKIEAALRKAFHAQGAGQDRDWRIQRVVLAADELIQEEDLLTPGAVHIERVQDLVEKALLNCGEQTIARAYILYRNARAKDRAQTRQCVRLDNGIVLCRHDLIDSAVRACRDLPHVNPAQIVDRAFLDLFDGASAKQVNNALVLTASALIERAPEYGFVAASFLLDELYCEVFKAGVTRGLTIDPDEGYRTTFRANLEAGVKAGLYNDRLLTQFDLDALASSLRSSRDRQFNYLGLQTVYDRYLVHVDGTHIEAPQSMFMRIAMGLSLQEDDPTGRAIEFYDLLSSFDYMASTPTLFNSGLVYSQLSSCYLTTVPDDLAGIFNAYRDNALLSKFAGGIGNDWTPVRALGSYIKGTNGKSQGVIPFLKIDNDTAVAVNQGGKRKGAICAYLETWHLDIEEFLELRKNTGDDRRRTHDLNTANWIPDLFMERVDLDAKWTLFSPDECGYLHDLYGDEFRAAYEELEAKAARGELRLFKQVDAKRLWRKMLTMLFETGHPWLTFKDPCNLRSPQQHVGVVHSSNLCTEITLNTSSSGYNDAGDRAASQGFTQEQMGEVAVCNLGSINLPQHFQRDGQGVLHLNMAKLERTVRLAVRMLDNVIDLNYYPLPEAHASNMRHRPVGLGMMGFQDVLYLAGVSFNSEGAVDFAATTAEAIAYYAYSASADLAQERGSYGSFVGSNWHKGVLPQDTVEAVAASRRHNGMAEGLLLSYDTGLGLDWEAVRARCMKGMRNSNVMAIAPTATIANIVGVVPSIEPSYKNLYVKSNLSGEFTVINEYLVRDLRDRGLWDDQMVADLKATDGSLLSIDRVPDDLKELYRTAFEVDSDFVIDAATARQLWVDQAQSLNLYLADVTGAKLDRTYRKLWRKGCKTSYYLRVAAASRAEKSTGRGGELNAVKVKTVETAQPEAPALEEGAVCVPFKRDDGTTGCSACE
jgi:ribonucleoside-diphosphate reductase alpha chain